MRLLAVRFTEGGMASEDVARVHREAIIVEGHRDMFEMNYLAAKGQQFPVLNATLPRLSHVVRRLEDRALVERFPCPEDGRATNARLTEAGWDAVVAAAPGHVDTVRHHVLDPLTRQQLGQLKEIGDALLSRLDPDGRMTALYDPERAE